MSWKLSQQLARCCQECCPVSPLSFCRGLFRKAQRKMDCSPFLWQTIYCLSICQRPFIVISFFQCLFALCCWTLSSRQLFKAVFFCLCYFFIWYYPHSTVLNHCSKRFEPCWPIMWSLHSLLPKLDVYRILMMPHLIHSVPILQKQHLDCTAVLATARPYLNTALLWAKC